MRSRKNKPMFTQKPTPQVVYIPKPDEDSAKMIKHDNTNHSATMAYLGYEGNRPEYKIVQSHVKAVLEEMKRRGYESPLVCLVEGGIWSDTIMFSEEES